MSRKAGIVWLHSLLDLSSRVQMSPREWIRATGDYLSWKRLRDASSSIDARLPWITSPAIRQLELMDLDGKRAVEWGAGGSTLFLLDRGMHVTTVEHNLAWLELVRGRLSEHEANLWFSILVEPTPRNDEKDWDPSDWNRAHSSESDQLDYTGYCSAPSADLKVELVLVDGRARPACLAYADQAFPNAILILDQSERAHYAPVIRHISISRGKGSHYPGSIRGFDHLSRTSFWPPR